MKRLITLWLSIILSFGAFVSISKAGINNCIPAWKCVPTVTSSPSPVPTPNSGWINIVNDQFDSGSVPTHWSLYNGPYGSSPHNCAVPSHAFVANGYLNMLMKYETSGNCGASWYTAGMQITHSLGAIDQRITLRWRVTGTNLAAVRSHRNIPMRWVSDPNYQWYQGESDYCEGSSLTVCSTFLHYANPGQITHAYTVDVTQWHIWQFIHKNNRVTAYIDGVLAWDYQGTTTTVPDAFRVAVLQQECQSSCPAYSTDTETIQIDWIQIDNVSP